MNTTNHHAIADEVGNKLLWEAFSKLSKGKPRIGAFYLGNWLTDVSQPVDEVAVPQAARKINQVVSSICSRLRQYVANVPFVSGKLTGAVNELQQDVCSAINVFTDSTFPKVMTDLWRVAGYFKFTHPVEKPGARGHLGGRHMDFNRYLEVFDNYFWCYKPYHHLDRPEIYRAGDDSPVYDSAVEKSLGVYNYLRDDIEIAAGMFAHIDLEWAPKAFNAADPMGRDDTDQKFNFFLTELGHAMHLVEDFFAHSTFVEQAALSLGGRFITKLTTMAPEDLFGFKDGHLTTDGGVFFKRLKRAERPGCPNPGKTSYEFNVVTGYFDTSDTLISIAHILEDIVGNVNALGPVAVFAGAHGGLGHKAKTVAQTGESIFKAMKNPKKASEKYRELFRQTLELWDDPARVLDDPTNEVAVKLHDQLDRYRDKRIPAEVSERLLPQVLSGLNVPGPIVKSWVNAITGLSTEIARIRLGFTLYRAMKFIAEFIREPSILIRKYIREYLTDQAAEVVSYYCKRIVYARLLGSERIGCHSLIAKDYGYEALAKHSNECARAVHWYIVDTLTRWKQKPRLLVKRSENSTPSTDGNTADNHPWIDWYDLLCYHLRQPVVMTKSFMAVEGRCAHVCQPGDTIDTLCERYKRTAYAPGKFTGDTIVNANPQLSVCRQMSPTEVSTTDQQSIPESPYSHYKLTVGQILTIPNQRQIFPSAKLVDRGRAWWRPIMIGRDWEPMKQKKYHQLRPVTKEEVKSLCNRAMSSRDRFDSKYGSKRCTLPLRVACSQECAGCKVSV
jgi:hypothetical protein